MFKEDRWKEKKKSRNPWIKPDGSVVGGIAQLQCKTEQTGLMQKSRKEEKKNLQRKERKIAWY